jgi:hypothetical protein
MLAFNLWPPPSARLTFACARTMWIAIRRSPRCIEVDDVFFRAPVTTFNFPETHMHTPILDTPPCISAVYNFEMPGVDPREA